MSEINLLRNILGSLTHIHLPEILAQARIGNIISQVRGFGMADFGD